MRDQLIVIESNTTGTGLLALKKAQALGLSPVFFTNDQRRYLGLEQIGCPIVVCDTNSFEALTQTIRECLDMNQVRGVMTTSEFYLETVARLAATYGLPGNPVHSIETCRNKARTRLCLQEAKVRQPRFAIVRSPAEVSQALATLAPPYVVKPADDTSSYGVRLCRSVEEVNAQVHSLLAMRTNVRGQSTAHTVLLEEFINAPEFSVEMFTWQETTCIGITEKRLTGFPYFVELQHIFPACLSAEETQEIQMTVRRALEAVGVTRGATHTEIKLTAEGCTIIEINARLAGGMIPELILISTEVDVLEQQLKAAVDLPPAIQIVPRGWAGIHFLVSDRAGTLKEVRGAESLRTMPGVEQVSITALPGKYVSPPQSAYDRLGYVIVRAETYSETVDGLQRAVGEIEIVLATEDRDKK